MGVVVAGGIVLCMHYQKTVVKWVNDGLETEEDNITKHQKFLTGAADEFWVEIGGMW